MRSCYHEKAIVVKSSHNVALETFREASVRPNMFKLLLSWWFLSDGLSTTVTIAGLYA